MTKGLFISFEGGEGAGKSTTIQKLQEALVEQGYPILVTREPGGIPIAEKIREVILDRTHTAIDARTEALLYAAARRQHLVEKVMPALVEGYIVICDRFVDSSLAYQGVARGLGIDEIWSINEFAIQELMPSLTIYMDIEPSIGLERIANAHQREVNRLDLESISFHDKVRAGYLELCKRYPERIEKIDASQSFEHVYNQVYASIITYLEGK